MTSYSASAAFNIYDTLYFGGKADVSQYLLTNETTNILSTIAILHGYVDEGDDYSCGFWVGTDTTSPTSDHQNVTAAGTYSEGDEFSASVASLNPGEYYHVRAWGHNDDYGFIYAAEESYFIARPNTSTNFKGIWTGPTNVTLSWTNATVPDGTNHSVVIYYSTTAPPGGATPGTWGTLGANESNYSQTTITTLSPDTTYHFAAWTYVNNSGSPSKAAFSSTFATTSNTTTGGVYNISVRYENESASGNLPVDLSRWGIHKFVIVHEDATDYVYFDDGTHTSTANGSFTTNSSGYFTLYANRTIRFVELYWNSSNNSLCTCYRLIVPLSQQRNITFYIRTNLLVYGESTAYFNNSLVYYTYGFKDPSTLFSPDNNAYADIYVYNSTGVKLTIHREYLSSNRQVFPMLIYNKKYFIGMGSNNLTIDRIGVAPTPDDTTPETIEIPLIDNITYTFFEVINLNIGWNDPGSGLYVLYQDTLFGTISATIWIWDMNNTLVFSETTTDNTHNFTYAGANWSQTHNIRLTVNHEIWPTNQTINFSLPGGISAITDITSLDDLFDTIFGNTPFINYETGETIQWTYVLVGVIAFIILTSFGYFNAAVGMMGVGGWLMIATVFISGIPVAWFAVGVFLIAMGLIFGLGGRNR